MRESKKDKREHDYGKLRRLSRSINHDPNKTIEDWYELFEDFNADEETHYVEFCRYLRHIGVNNHGRANIKHDRERRTLGFRKMIQKKRERSDRKVEYRENDDE